MQNVILVTRNNITESTLSISVLSAIAHVANSAQHCHLFNEPG